MRPITLDWDSPGISPWAPVNAYEDESLGLYFFLGPQAAITVSVQLTVDDLSNVKDCTVSQSGTTVTVVFSNHQLAVGDAVVISNSGYSTLNGNREIASVVDENTITYELFGSNTISSTPAKAVGLHVFDHATLVGVTANAQGVQSGPITAVCMNITDYIIGGGQLRILQPRDAL